MASGELSPGDVRSAVLLWQRGPTKKGRRPAVRFSLGFSAFFLLFNLF